VKRNVAKQEKRAKKRQASQTAQQSDVMQEDTPGPSSSSGAWALAHAQSKSKAPSRMLRSYP